MSEDPAPEKPGDAGGRPRAKTCFEKIRDWRRTRLPWITTGRVLAASYAAVIVAVTCWLVPAPSGPAHFRAVRDLGANTRLADVLLVAPAGVSLEDRFRLAREKKRLTGRYLKTPVKGGNCVAHAETLDWPAVKVEEAVPLELDAEPDWMLLNQGTMVQVWTGDELQRALVLAVVPFGPKWIALLRKSDLKPGPLGTPKLPAKLRIETLPVPPDEPSAAPCR